MKRYIGPVLFGVVGVAILINLGLWQLRRLEVKEAKLAAIAAMLAGPLRDLPADGADIANCRYCGVEAKGRWSGEVVFSLDSLPYGGPGRRVIAVLEMAGGRRVLVDRGIWLDGTQAAPEEPHEAAIVGNLDDPQETDSYTPEPDREKRLWFARDVDGMAAALKTEPTLIVAREPTGDGITPMPVDTSAIPNNHWQYAVTWFLLAAAWLGMTAALLWRIRQRGE